MSLSYADFFSQSFDFFNVSTRIDYSSSFGYLPQRQSTHDKLIATVRFKDLSIW